MGAGVPTPLAAGRSPTVIYGARCQCTASPAAGRSPTATVGDWGQCTTPPAAGRSPPAFHRTWGPGPTLLLWAGARYPQSL